MKTLTTCFFCIFLAGCAAVPAMTGEVIADQIEWANIDAEGRSTSVMTDSEKATFSKIVELHRTIGKQIYFSTAGVPSNSILRQTNARSGCSTLPLGGDHYKFSTTMQQILENHLVENMANHFPNQPDDSSDSILNYFICIDYTSLRTTGSECDAHRLSYRYYLAEVPRNISRPTRGGSTCSLADYNPVSNGGDLIYSSPLLITEGTFSDISISRNPDGKINVNEKELFSQLAATHRILLQTLSDRRLSRALKDYAVVQRDVAGSSKNNGERLDPAVECRALGFYDGTEGFVKCVNQLKGGF